MKNQRCTPDYYGRILVVLHRLKELYPTYNMGRHLSTILNDCGDIWGMSDKALLTDLQEYKKQLELDVSHDDKEIDKIIDEGIHLDKILINDDDNKDIYGDYE